MIYLSPENRYGCTLGISLLVEKGGFGIVAGLEVVQVVA
jgi:hypothetical protein